MQKVLMWIELSQFYRQGEPELDDNIDLEALDAYLSSDDSPENCMMLSDMDGFLHGVICSPVMIPSEEWMPVALGADPADIPEWVLNDITDLYMEVFV